MPHPAPTSRPQSRRVVLRTALAGLAGAIAATLGRPSAVRAGVDGDLVLEAVNTVDATTTMSNATNGATVLDVFGQGSAISASSLGTAVSAYSVAANAVVAITETGIGVYAESEFLGVNGTSSGATGAGVLGWGNGNGIGVVGVSSDGPPLTGGGPGKIGVYGLSTEDDASVGVRGDTEAGTGALGIATTGTGVTGRTDAGVGVVGASYVGSDLGWPSPITPSTGVYGISLDGTGVYGASNSGAGVYAATNATTVAAIVGQGDDGTGLHGHAGVYPVPASPSLTGVLGTAFGGGTAIAGFSGPDLSTPPQPPARTGVHGYAAHDASSRGVVGESPAGQGVRGLSATGIGMRGYSESGVAGSFETASGMALVTKGRVRFQNIAGRSSIASGASAVTVTPGVDLTSGSSVLATINGDPGGTTAVQRVTLDTTANTFTVHLTATATSAVKVAWFVLDQ